MDVRGPNFVGDWDVYSGPMHTELQLDGFGKYRHTLWGTIRKHWGKWSLEDQGGTTFLVLRLEDAYPRVEAGLYGWQQVQWPSIEAWAVLSYEGAMITLSNALMVRRASSMPSAPAYMPAAPFESVLAASPPAAINLPPLTGAMQPTAQSGSTTRGSERAGNAPGPDVSFPGPRRVAQDLPAPPPQSVMNQWKAENTSWDSVRDVIAKTLQEDSDTTGRINELYASQGAKEIKSQNDHAKAMSDIVHGNVEPFIRMLKR